jgi:hypothetical protein
VSQGFLFNVPNADVAIQNRGGCRTDILGPGDFSKLPPSERVPMTPLRIAFPYALYLPFLFSSSLWKRL